MGDTKIDNVAEKTTKFSVETEPLPKHKSVDTSSLNLSAANLNANVDNVVDKSDEASLLLQPVSGGHEFAEEKGAQPSDAPVMISGPSTDKTQRQKESTANVDMSEDASLLQPSGGRLVAEDNGVGSFSITP